jgi:hypothetical protein
MTLIKVDVATWKSDVENDTFIAGDTYEIFDLAQNIAGLPAIDISDMTKPLMEIASKDTSLVIDYAQAEAILNVDAEGRENLPYVTLAAPSGDKVIFADTAATVLNLSSYFFQQLEEAGVNAFGIIDITSDGIVIGSGGEVEAQSGATVDRAVVQNGGELLGDVGSTINDTVIQSGGLLDLTTGAAGSGTIDFAPVVGDAPGGTLKIDDLYLPSFTIDGFAVGDTIDLTGLSFDPNGTAVPAHGTNVLNVTENNTTYSLQLDPSQNFTGEYFKLSQDGGGTGSGTDITLLTSPSANNETFLNAVYEDILSRP